MQPLEKIEKGAVVELHNCRIIDVKKGCLFPEDTVLQIRDDRILSICHKHQCVSSSDYTVDMHGKYLMPGMINTHAHIHIVMPGILVRMKDMKRAQQYTGKQIVKGLNDCLEYGITVVRDALSDKLKELNELKQQIKSGSLKGPEIYNSVHIAPLGGTYAPKYSFLQRNIMKLFNHKPADYSSSDVGIVTVPANATEYHIKQSVEIAAKRGADFIKFCDQDEKMLTYKPGALNFDHHSLQAAVDECRKLNLKTNIHHITLNAFRKSLKSGVSFLAHLPLDQQLTAQDLELFKGFDTMIEPTLTVAYFYCWAFRGSEIKDHDNLRQLEKIRSQTYATIIKKYWIRELQDIALHHFKKAQQQNFKTMGFVDMSKVFRLMGGYISYGIENMEALLKAGLHDRIAFGNDAGASQCSPAAKDAELDLYRFCARKCGIGDPEINKQLIQQFTINGAKMMGIENTHGSFEKTKQADIAVFPDNPLKDIEILKQKVDALWIKGKLQINHCGLKAESIS